jgi:hypothetical protein
LDETIKNFGYANTDYTEAIAKIDKFRRDVLREMWCERQKTKQASHRKQAESGDYTLHNLSHLRPHEKWKLGQRLEEDEELHDLWKAICSKPFKKTQDLQQKMLERIRETERNEKVASSRVNRLRGLGNAIVPQVAAELMKIIKKLEPNQL